MHFNTFKHYESIIGPVIEKTAKESCLKAALEEKELLQKNQLDVCKQLSPEVAQHIYPSMSLKDIDLEENEVDPNDKKSSQASPDDSILYYTNSRLQEALEVNQDDKSVKELSEKKLKTSNFSKTSSKAKVVISSHENETTILNKQ